MKETLCLTPHYRTYPATMEKMMHPSSCLEAAGHRQPATQCYDRELDTIVPVTASHIQTVLSSKPDTIFFPSGLNATDVTGFE